MLVDPKNGSCGFVSPALKARVSVGVIAYKGEIIRD